MNLRLPIVLAVVTVAAGAAVYRAGRPATPTVAPFASDAPAADTVSARLPRRPALARHGIVVYVAGAVRHGGLFTLPAGARAMDALRAAGGASEGADLVAVNLAQQLADGDEVAVPSLDGPSQGAAPGRRAHRSKRGSHGRKHRHHHRRSAPLAVSADTGDASDGPASVVDLNTADESELETLPGVGATLAARIVTFREATGAFSTPDDLLDVSGVTQSKLDAIEPYVTTGAAPPQP